MEENHYRTHLDLHKSEWRHDKKKEPILGAGSYWFFNVTLPTIVFAVAFGYLMKFIVYGLFG